MKKSRYTVEQITYALRQAEGGTPVADVCRQLGVSEASFYVWKKRYGNLGLTEIRELRQLRDENARLKRLVADLTLDLQSLKALNLKLTKPKVKRWPPFSLKRTLVIGIESPLASYLAAFDLSQPVRKSGKRSRYRQAYEGINHGA